MVSHRYITCAFALIAYSLHSSQALEVENFPKVLRDLEAGMSGGLSQYKKTDQDPNKGGCKRTDGRTGFVDIEAHLQTSGAMRSKTLEKNGYTFVENAWRPDHAIAALGRGGDEEDQAPDEQEAAPPSYGNNVASYIERMGDMAYTEFEMKIWEVAKKNLKKQMKQCRRRIGVFGHSCDELGKQDCERDNMCQWFTIDDIVLIHELELPAPDSLDFASDDHFHKTRKAAHNTIWTLGEKGGDFKDQDFARMLYLNNFETFASLMKQDARRSRRTQVKDICNSIRIEKKTTCRGLTNKECDKSFQTLDDNCGTRSDCRLCTVDSRCEWFKAAGQAAGTCRDKINAAPDDDDFKATSIDECFQYDEKMYGTECFRHGSCQQCTSAANGACKWVWYEAVAPSETFPSPKCMRVATTISNHHGFVTKFTKETDGSARESCGDYRHDDEHAMKRPQLTAYPCKWNPAGHGSCERNDDQNECLRGGAVGTRFESLTFPTTNIARYDATRTVGDTCSWNDDGKAWMKEILGYTVGATGVPRLHIDTDLPIPELDFYLIEGGPVKVRGEAFYGLDVFNAWGPLDDEIYVAPLAMRDDDGKDPTHPSYPHRCLKDGGKIKLNYVQAKSGSMWLWKTTHVMHGAVNVFDDRILEHTSESNCRTSVEYRFVAISKTRPEALCLHHATVYDPTTCTVRGKHCRRISDNECFTKDGPGVPRDADCADHNNCFFCTMSSPGKCEWVKVRVEEKPKCRRGCKKGDTRMTYDSPRNGCSNMCPSSAPCQSEPNADGPSCLCYTRDGGLPSSVLNPSLPAHNVLSQRAGVERHAVSAEQCFANHAPDLNARFRSVENAPSVSTESDAVDPDLKLCRNLLEYELAHDENMGGMPARLPEPCRRYLDAHREFPESDPRPSSEATANSPRFRSRRAALALEPEKM